MKYLRGNLSKSSRRILVILFFLLVVFSLSFFISKLFFNNSLEKQRAADDSKQYKLPDKPKVDNEKSPVNDENTADIRETKNPAGRDMDNSIKELGIKGEKVAYLTFDDGPSPKTTPNVLNILDKYNIKATFFVIGKEADAYKYLIQREYNEGDAVGDHTYTHDYKYIYQDPQNLLQDFDKCAKSIHSILGANYSIKYVRFPGGAFGKKLEPFRQAVTSAGYTFIDWNSFNGDAEGNNIPADKLLDNIKKTSHGKNTLVILMHDAATKLTTVEALPQIIEYLKAQGYIFKTLS